MNAALRNPLRTRGRRSRLGRRSRCPAAASATVTVNAAGDPITFTGRRRRRQPRADGVGRQDRPQPARVAGLRLADRPRSERRRTPRTGTWRARTSSIRGGGGGDILNAGGLGNTYNSLDIQGDAGDDTITGGGKADPLAGGDGDDRVVGNPGNDTMTGGNGNDVLVWNNGDGSDTMDGDAGNDEIEVNGSANAGDHFTITPGANGRTTFDRLNLVPFKLDTLAERMTVSGLGGDDAIAGAAGPRRPHPADAQRQHRPRHDHRRRRRRPRERRRGGRRPRRRRRATTRSPATAAATRCGAALGTTCSSGTTATGPTWPRAAMAPT